LFEKLGRDLNFLNSVFTVWLKSDKSAIRFDRVIASPQDVFTSTGTTKSAEAEQTGCKMRLLPFLAAVLTLRHVQASESVFNVHDDVLAFPQVCFPHGNSLVYLLTL
jgi:hypothetical protein